MIGSRIKVWDNTIGFKQTVNVGKYTLFWKKIVFQILNLHSSTVRKIFDPLWRSVKSIILPT